MRNYLMILFLISLAHNAFSQRNKFENSMSYNNEISVVGSNILEDHGIIYLGIAYSRSIKKFKKKSAFIDINVSNSWIIYESYNSDFRFSEILGQLSIRYNKQINDFILSGGVGGTIFSNNFFITPAIDLNIKKTNFVFKRTNINVGFTLNFHPGVNHYVDSTVLKNVVIAQPGYVPSAYVDVKNWYYVFNIKIGRYF